MIIHFFLLFRNDLFRKKPHTEYQMFGVGKNYASGVSVGS